MHFCTQRLSQLLAADIRNRVQRQTVVELIVVEQVLPYAVDDEVYQLVLLVQEQSNSEISDLLLRVLGGRDEVDGFEMSKIDVPPENVDVQQLADVFLLLVAVEPAIPKLLPYVGQFLVDALLLELAGAGVPQVGDERDQPSHGGHIARLVPTEKPACAARGHLRWQRHGGGCGRSHRSERLQCDGGEVRGIDGSGFGQGLCRRARRCGAGEGERGRRETRGQLEEQGSSEGETAE
jgi:hypothetical protein